MKILYVLASLSVEWGGPVTVAKGLGEALSKKGVELHVIASVPTHKKNSIIQLQVNKVSVYPQDILSKFWRSHSFALKKDLKNVIDNFDLIHIHEIWHYPHYVAYNLTKKLKKPYIVSIHGALTPWCLNHKGFKKKIFSVLIQKKILREASALHAITEMELNNIVDFGIRNTPIFLLPNGINLEDFQILPQREEIFELYPELKGKKIILFLGRIHPKKGLDLLAKAFSKISNKIRDAYLLIVGPDEIGYQSQIERLLEKEGVLKKVIFTGMLTGNEKLIVLSGADIFVLPSYSEGFSMSVLEAMACGLPVIITTGCNFPEVEKMGAGRVINPEVEQLSETLIEMLEGDELCKSMGLRGKKLIQEKYNWDKIADEMIIQYKKIINR